MSTLTTNYNQSTNEIRTYTVDYSQGLPTGWSITAGTATHTPVSGTASALTLQVTSPYIYVTVPALSTIGTHYVDVLATFSDGDKSNARIAINVLYPTPTARATMASLIATLRGMTNAGIDDYIIANVPYWSDNHLQNALDRHAAPIRDEQLTAIPALAAGGSINYFDYQSGNRYFEETSGGTARFVVRDNNGSIVSSASYSVDYERGLVTFTANTLGAVYTLTGWSYDVYAAAADIWYQKAAHASEMIDFTTDNHNIKRSHIANLAYQMARKYEMMSTSGAGSSTEMDRGDMNVHH